METKSSKILDYLKTQNVGVLAIEMSDGSPHGATMHFANSDTDPVVFYFSTRKNSRKGTVLLEKENCRATLVVGFDENIPKTLQIDGVAEIIKPEDQLEFNSIYLSKFEDRKDMVSNPEALNFKLTSDKVAFMDRTK